MRTRTLTILAIAAIAILAKPASAQHPCDPYAPYYHQTETGPGALLADLFFFTMSTPIAVVAVGGARRNVINPRTREVRRVSTAACMPIATARHFGQTRPPHVEHWRAE